MPDTSLDPERFVRSPYAADRTPLPTLDELVSLGLAPKTEEKAVQVSTRVSPGLVFAIDRLIEKGAYKLKSRQEFFRLALANLVSDLVEEIQQEHVKATVYRLERMRARVGELRQMIDAFSMVELTRKAVGMFLHYDNRVEAIQALREAKRYAEEIPFPGLRARYVNALYGSLDGAALPDAWENDPVAALWDEVWEGGLDHDVDEAPGKMKVY